MPSSHDSPSPAPSKRPSLTERASSSHSVSRASPSADPHSASISYKGSSHRLHRPHVVGHNRVAHSRNPSYGKNLNKIIKLAAAHPAAVASGIGGLGGGAAGAGAGAGDGGTAAGPRRHNRSKSTTPSTSPHAQAHHVERNSSHVSLPRTASKVSVRKNWSTLSLKRNGSLKRLERESDADLAPDGDTRLKSHKTKQSQKAPPPVKFSIGSDGHDDEWTEESNSQSPETTRRSSVAPSEEPRARRRSSSPPPAPSPPPDTSHPLSSARPPPQSPPQDIPRLADRSSFHYRSRILDADAITSRLLQRHPPHMLPPRLSSISATATPTGGHSPRSFGHSHVSTLNGTPSMPHDGVSRFITGSSNSGGTSADNSHGTCKTLSTSSPPNGSLDASKRAKSTSHITSSRPDEEVDEDDDEPRALPPRSRQHSTHGVFNASQSSRTQQKLNLQRASSNMEPPQPGPAPVALSQAVNGAVLPGPSGQAPEATRLAKQYEQACMEYAVVRRYKNPVGDALGRLDQVPGAKDVMERRIQIERPRTRPGEKRDAGDKGKMGLSQSLREDRRPKGNGRIDGRVRFDTGSKDDSGIGGHHDSTEDDDGDGDGSTEQLVRRMWESRIDASSDD